MTFFSKHRLKWTLGGALAGFFITALGLMFADEVNSVKENFQLMLIGSIIFAIIGWLVSFMSSAEIGAPSQYGRDPSGDHYSGGSDGGGSDGGGGGD